MKNTKKYFFRYLRQILLLAGIATGLYACFPSYSDRIDDFDMAATTHDETVDFQSFKTYYVPDTIIHIKDTINVGTNVDISRENDDFIIQEFKRNMEVNGYTEVTDPDDPNLDIAVLISIAASQNTGITNYYPWYGTWGWAFPEYGPSFNWFYPWGGVSQVYSFTTGTIYFAMIDYQNIDSGEEEIPVVWLGGIDGVFETSTGLSTEERLTKGIDQCFRQSPYLKLN
ncbi:DUF4136 domain-containing protein [Flammeovirgaceae bacterium SG7u.111]|nr:DUF4136 domain-containing protein [Flammeovirgaceae bacterium SG7u.132]WPO36148.1 DUF4136 domain-containing protein [Flammeovirgaceae bacterium SG7u.111]